MDKARCIIGDILTENMMLTVRSKAKNCLVAPFRTMSEKHFSFVSLVCTVSIYTLYNSQSIFLIFTAITAIVVTAQTTIHNGSDFYGDTNNKYENQILNCNSDLNCNVNCTQHESCFNATVICPMNPNTNCTVSCSNTSSCNYMDIHWNTDSSSTDSNKLTCDTKACRCTMHWVRCVSKCDCLLAG